MSVAGLALPPVIPALPSMQQYSANSRSLVLLLDGTGDQFDADNSNVVKFFGALKKDSPQQLVYYQAGIGTTTESGKMQSGVSAAADMAVGSGLGNHVKQAYEFLMANYKEGDKICILGFSRGAYTARCLAGMLHKIGLLPAHNTAQVPFGWHMFKDDTPYGWAMSAEFKSTFSIDVGVHFLGAWDTVASVGFIPRTLPFGKEENSSVKFFRHAMALDERRAKFKVAHWHQRKPDSATEGDFVPGSATPTVTQAQLLEQRRASAQIAAALAKKPSVSNAMTASFVAEPEPLERDGSSSGDEGEGKYQPPKQAGSPSRRKSLPIPFRNSGPRLSKDRVQSMLSKQFNEIDALAFGGESQQTDVLEVWFAGAHADVGGGAVPNETRHVLANIPLRWMIRQAFACGTGILFHTDTLANYGLDVHTMHPVLLERPKPFCGPPPSAIDAFARGDLPSLADRRSSIRASRSAAQMLSRNSTSRSLPGISDFGPFFGGSPFDNRLTMAQLEQRIVQPEGVLPEAYEDYFDAMAPINDQLEQAKGWWILECTPCKRRVQQPDGSWKKVVTLNMGRRRTMRDDHPKVHYSVLSRQGKLGYSIANIINENAVIEYVM